MLKINETIDSTTQENCKRFQKPDVAGKYPPQYGEGRSNDQREKRAILRCLQLLPANCHVLDFPCGSGRLLGLLKEQGFNVSGADSSASMLEQVREHFAEDEVCLYERDVFSSGFADNEFDAVICNRLFHHFLTSEDRKKAITELARISKGPVIFSFFNTFSLSMTYRILRKRLKGKKLTDRVPVPLDVIRNEIEECGMKVVTDIPKRWGISAMWYVIMEPASKA